MRESAPSYRDGMANYNVYRCQDDNYLAVAPLEPQFWEEFCKRIERPDLTGKYPLGPNQEMKATLASIIATKTRDEWAQIFADGNCCVSPVNSILEACHYQPARERQVLCTIEHPTLGTVPQLRTPTPFDERSQETLKAPPEPAKQTRVVLEQLGYSPELIEQLASSAVIPPLVASEIS